MFTTYLVVSLCALAGVSCFLIGALVQQHLSYKKIKSVMVTDSYVYHCRQNIFESLSFLGVKDNITRLSNATPRNTESDSVRKSYSLIEQFALWSRIKAYRAIGRGSYTDTKYNHIADIMKYGFPGLDEIHVYKNFVLSYDRRNRIAHWVCEHLTGDCLTMKDTQKLEKPKAYISDVTIPQMFSADMRDFKNTQFVGGHLASPHNYGCDVVKFLETYKFPNIVPINRKLKNHVWQRLENYVRDMSLEWGSIYVYTGPIFMPQRITFRNWSTRYHVIGMNTVAVPTHFFKIIIRDTTLDNELPFMEGYVVPNAYVDKEMDLLSFLADIRDIEHFAGLRFCDGLQRDRLDLPVSRPSMTDLEQ
ncbi:endonuclease G, mitochondrial [Drosophila eugracilis]|uniref:endonuclease G, mitochondrial n=1 Tax=Drosophila eugracilis TaxID=29029 RepID=UPI0007E7D798|nr:endonuclease G, mitochondrial [Drosophila eugracilis]